MEVRLLGWAALLVLCVGCSSPGPPAAKTIDVSIDEVLKQSTITRDVTLAVGDALKVSLGANHSTPYRWTLDPAKFGPVLNQTSHEYVHGESRPGAPGTEVWTFTATKAGQGAIVAGYGPIAGDPIPTCTFTANVTVRP